MEITEIIEVLSEDLPLIDYSGVNKAKDKLDDAIRGYSH